MITKVKLERMKMKDLSKLYRKETGKPVTRELNKKGVLVEALWKHYLATKEGLERQVDILEYKASGERDANTWAISQIMDGCDVNTVLKEWTKLAGNWYFKKPATNLKRELMEEMDIDVTLYPVWQEVRDAIRKDTLARNFKYQNNALGHVVDGELTEERLTIDYKRYCGLREVLVEEDWRELAIKIIMLTGRRPNELFCNVSFESIELQPLGYPIINMRGAAKSKKGVVKRIFCDTPAEELNRMLTKLRGMVNFDTPKQFDKSSQRKALEEHCKTIFSDIADSKVTPKTLRGCYGAEVWKKYIDKWGLEQAARIGESNIYPQALGITTSASYAYTRVNWT